MYQHLKTILGIFIISGLTALPASAQDTQSTSSEPMDEVVATGTLQRDNAMAAYLSGDYVTAEIEFDKNAFCALRASRNFRAGIDAAYDSTVRADVGVDANIPAQPTGGQGGANVTPSAPTSAPSARFNNNFRTKDDDIRSRTCEDRGYQLYMRGLSQLKLGKLEESKDSFKRAVVLRKSIWDAYFRLALLEYQDGDVKAAKRNFKQLKRLQKNCRKCESEAEIDEQVAYLKKTLG